MQRDFFLSPPNSASSATQPASDNTAGAAEQPAGNIASTEAEQSSGSAARSSGSAERPADHSANTTAERRDHHFSDVERTTASLATRNCSAMWDPLVERLEVRCEAVDEIAQIPRVLRPCSRWQNRCATSSTQND